MIASAATHPVAPAMAFPQTPAPAAVQASTLSTPPASNAISLARAALVLGRSTASRAFQEEFSTLLQLLVLSPAPAPAYHIITTLRYARAATQTASLASTSLLTPASHANPQAKSFSTSTTPAMQVVPTDTITTPQKKTVSPATRSA